MNYGKAGWSSISEPSPVVATGNGSVRGFCRNANAVFLGIPYGANCDGSARFKAPTPAKPWKGVRDCTQFGPIAMQDKQNWDMLPDSVKETMQEYANVFTGGVAVDQSAETPSENCLVLNVVTPGIDKNKRPVMVYIHGGGYMSGTGSVTSAISDKLLDEENIVLVTVNHRLNVFGSLYLGGLDDEYRESGILTQLDLLLALAWVKQNITSFGGNPDSVTLIGESGGGTKIHHLLAMPESQGLFHRAIIMSGSIPAAAKSHEQGTAETLEVMKKLGLGKESWRELLTMPAENLFAAARGMELIQPKSTPFLPTPDGIRMPINPAGAFMVCEQTAAIPTIIGYSEEELTTNLLDPALTWEGLRSSLLEKKNPLFSVLDKLTEQNIDELIGIIRRHNGDSKAPWQTLIQIVSTAHFLGGGSYWAAVARAKAGAPVWHYTTAYDTPLPGTSGLLACAWHTADLPLAFRAVYHKQAESLSKSIAHSFTAFARTGNPSTEALEWPVFKPEPKETMLFDKTCTVKADPYHEIYEILESVCRSM